MDLPHGAEGSAVPGAASDASAATMVLAVLAGGHPDPFAAAPTAGDVIDALGRIAAAAIPDATCTVHAPTTATVLPSGGWAVPMVSPRGMTVGHLLVEPAVPRAPAPAEHQLLTLLAGLGAARLDRGTGDPGPRPTAPRSASDPLTGLATREVLLAETSQLLRTGRTPAVIFCDVDRFRMINAGLGYETGDVVLRTVAARLRTLVREGDLVARFGGDEFALLVADAGVGQARALADRLVAAVGEPIAAAGRRLHVSMSMGIAVASGDDPFEVIRHADVAMYQAKQLGHRHVVVHRPRTHDADALDQFTVEQELRDALATGQLRTHLQPIVRCGDLQVVGVETLVRWQHPERGLLAPGAFLDAARASGQLEAIDRWVLQAATAEVASWRLPPHLSPMVTVNLDAAASVLPGSADALLASLTRAGLPPHRLVIEVTEQVFVADQRAVVDTLDELRAHGVRIAIDDFGTGHSSLDRLRSLPLDMLKIDRSFVAGAERDAESAALLDAIATMGHAVGLDVLAEGVETEAQVQAIRMAGCDLAQGYFFGKPMPPAEVLALLAAGGVPVDAAG